MDNVLLHARETVPYYQRYFSSQEIGKNGICLEAFPTIRKRQIQKYADLFLSQKFSTLLYQGEIVLKPTSGSTGDSLLVKWLKSDLVRSLCPLWLYRKKYFDITPADRVVSFHHIIAHGGRVIKNTPLEFSFGKNNISFYQQNLTEKRLLEIVAKIQIFAPKYILAFPSTLQKIADFAVAQKKQFPTVTYIELSGEYVTSVIKKRIQMAFPGAHIANQYGMTEINTMGVQAPNGYFEIFHENVYIEILDKEGNVLPDGQEGNIYATCLQNYLMPFIRYETGDMGRLYKDQGRAYLSLTQGRTADYIVTEGGEKISTHCLHYAQEIVCQQMPGIIRDIQIEQISPCAFTAYICVEDGYCSWKEAIQESFLMHIPEERVRIARWTFVVSDKPRVQKEPKKKFFKKIF